MWPALLPAIADEAMTEIIEEELYQADLSPREHCVDAGYVSARVLVNSQQHFGIEVVGPVSVDNQWQAHCPSGIDASQFVLDWQHQQATCESEVIMLRRANNRAFSASELLWALAAARATVFHGVDVVVVQKIATAVCSDERVLLFAAPTDLTSFTSLA